MFFFISLEQNRGLPRNFITVNRKISYTLLDGSVLTELILQNIQHQNQCLISWYWNGIADLFIAAAVIVFHLSYVKNTFFICYYWSIISKIFSILCMYLRWQLFFFLLASKADILNKVIISPLLFIYLTNHQTKDMRYRMFGIAHEIKRLKILCCKSVWNGYFQHFLTDANLPFLKIYNSINKHYIQIQMSSIKK